MAAALLAPRGSLPLPLASRRRVVARLARSARASSSAPAPSSSRDVDAAVPSDRPVGGPTVGFVPIEKKRALHVHVGAGRLAMGLLVPSLVQSDVPLVVLQAPREPWNGVYDALAGVDGGEPRLNLEVAHHPGVVRTRLVAVPADRDDADAEAAVAEILSLLLDGAPDAPPGVFVISPDTERVWLPILAAATSISTAVGPALVPWLGETLLRRLPAPPDEGGASSSSASSEASSSSASEASSSSASSGKQLKTAASPSVPRVYCCENDHAAVAELASLLGARARVVPCVVDKVCQALVVDAAPEVEEEEGVAASKAPRRWTARVATERFPGMILPLAPTARDDPLLPFAANGGDNKNRRGDDLSGPLRLVSDEACAAFLHDKKLTQVNGTHTALAFVALAEAPLATYAGELAIDAPRDLASVPLRSLAGMSERHARALWLWCVAEALELLLDHGADVAKRALGDLETDAELIDVMLADAKMALERLSASAPEDTVGRVLNAGVLVRLEGRLRVVWEKLDREVRVKGKAGMGETHRRFVQEAGAGDVETLLGACEELYAQCDDVARFVAGEGSAKGAGPR